MGCGLSREPEVKRFYYSNPETELESVSSLDNKDNKQDDAENAGKSKISVVKQDDVWIYKY